MSSIQSSLLSQPLPLADATEGSPKSARISAQDPEKVAKEFESVFASMMLKEMRKTLESGNLFAEDPSDIYGGMFTISLMEEWPSTYPVPSGGFWVWSKMIREGLERVMPKPEQQAIAPAKVN